MQNNNNQRVYLNTKNKLATSERIERLARFISHHICRKSHRFELVQCHRDNNKDHRTHNMDYHQGYIDLLPLNVLKGYHIVRTLMDTNPCS
jgi:hypothetical protein